MTAVAQRTNVRIAALSLADLARDHEIIVAHGNGPQVGLLALQGASYDPSKPWPLDVLGAETDGMIGYLIEQKLMNALPEGARFATLLSRVEVDPNDPAFEHPSKPIGPVYSAQEATQISNDHGWEMVTEASGDQRRVVPSPLPLRILGLDAIKVLLDAQHVVICAGGGGIPVMRNADGDMEGVEVVIDKDRTSTLLATALETDALLLLTDVAAVYKDFIGPDKQVIAATTPNNLEKLNLLAGSMGPRVAAACAFVRTSGKRAGIGQLTDARAILQGQAESFINPDQPKNHRHSTFNLRTLGFMGADQPVSVWIEDGGAIK
jgi:carbamate kinase